MLPVVAFVAVLTAGVVLVLGYWRQEERRQARIDAAARHRRELEADAARHVREFEHEADGDRLLDDLVAQRVVVSMKSGDGFAGLLVAEDRRSLRLAEAMGVSRTGERAPVDGTCLVPRAEVAYIQRPAG